MYFSAAKSDRKNTVFRGKETYFFLIIGWTTVNKIWALLSMRRTFFYKDFRLFERQNRPNPGA